MRNLKCKTPSGHAYTVKLPKDGTGKGTPAWYRREVPSAADFKARVVKGGGTLAGTRQR